MIGEDIMISGMCLDLEIEPAPLTYVPRDTGQGEIALKGFWADGGGKAVSVAEEEGWRSCQDHAGTKSPSLFLPVVRGTGEGSDLPRAHGTPGLFFTSAIGEGQLGGIALFFTNSRS